MPFSLKMSVQRHPKYSEFSERPIRILHVVGKMDRGGLETWIMRVLRLIDREQFQLDIMVHASEPGAYDPEVLALGCRILYCPYLSQPWRYATAFKRLLQTYGPYDVVHSHVHFFSGYVLKLAKAAQIPCRIAHSHNDHRIAEQQQTSLLRQGYLRLMKHWILQSMTHGLATSQQAALDLFGATGSTDRRIRLLFCGLDLSAFETEVSSAKVRQALGIPANAWVVGHAGRFEHQKNHDFLVRVAVEAMGKQPNLYLILVGQGTLRAQVEAQVEALGVSDRVIFIEPRADLPELLLGAFDIFLFPSVHEGLGVALLEAQAAGLPCITSDVVPVEADVIPNLVRRLSLDQSPAEWAKALLAHSEHTPRMRVRDTLSQIRSSPFNMENSVPLLTELYLQAVYQ